MGMHTKTIYDPMARGLHWLMAVVIIALIGVGLVMSDLERDDPLKWQLYANHKAIGMIALVLIGIRILWRAHSRPPKPLPSQSPLEQWVAHLVHLALYFVMVAMPVSGYIMSSAGGHAISIFGLFNVPLLVGKNEAIGHLAKEVHEVAGNVLIGAIVLHFVGALKHHFIDKDATISRMWPRRASR